jgi:hypothetical protein
MEKLTKAFKRADTSDKITATYIAIILAGSILVAGLGVSKALGNPSSAIKVSRNSTLSQSLTLGQ